MNYFPSVDKVRESFIQSSEDHLLSLLRAAGATHNHMVSSEEKFTFEDPQLQCFSALGDSDKNSLHFVYEFPGNVFSWCFKRKQPFLSLARPTCTKPIFWLWEG
jgi:hypothetical protein